MAILSLMAVTLPREADALNVLDTNNPINLQLAADHLHKGPAWGNFTRTDGTISLAGLTSYGTLGAPATAGLTGAVRVDGSTGDFINAEIALYQSTHVPEPSAFGLLALGVGLIGTSRRSHRVS